MARAPAAGAGRGAAGGRGAGRGAAAPAARRSPPRPAAGGVNALIAGMANVQVADPPFQPFNFDAAAINIMVETPTMSTSGRRTVIGTFLIPNSPETDVIMQVSADGWYAELSLRVPTMFLFLVERFAQEVGANHPNAPVIMAALRDAQNLMLHEHPDLNIVRTSVQRCRLPFPCIQNPVLDFLYLDEGLQSGMTTVLTVTFESQERVRTTINYGSHRVIVRNPSRGGGGGLGVGDAAAAGVGAAAAAGVGAAAAAGVGAAPMAVDGAAAAGGGVPLGGNPINNGLFAAEMQRQAREAARQQQNQALPRGH